MSVAMVAMVGTGVVAAVAGNDPTVPIILIVSGSFLPIHWRGEGGEYLLLPGGASNGGAQ